MAKEKEEIPQGPACRIYVAKKKLGVDDGDACALCDMNWLRHELIPIGLGKFLNANTFGTPCS